MKMCTRDKFNFNYKTISFVILTVASLLNPFISYAQDLPCGGDDPYESCPLDTWVWVLAITALVFGAVYIYRQQKINSRT